MFNRSEDYVFDMSLLSFVSTMMNFILVSKIYLANVETKFSLSRVDLTNVYYKDIYKITMVVFL